MDAFFKSERTGGQVLRTSPPAQEKAPDSVKDTKKGSIHMYGQHCPILQSTRPHSENKPWDPVIGQVPNPWKQKKDRDHSEYVGKSHREN